MIAIEIVLPTCSFFDPEGERKREERVSVPDGSSVGDLVRELVAHYGPELEQRLMRGDELGPLATILVDGVNCAGQGGLDTRLSGQNVVEIVVMGPPTMGG